MTKQRFAVDAAHLLYTAANRGAFDSLVLLAEPQVLGAIREQLHQEVKRRLIGEIPKTLTKQPTEAIARHVVVSLERASA